MQQVLGSQQHQRLHKRPARNVCFNICVHSKVPALLLLLLLGDVITAYSSRQKACLASKLRYHHDGLSRAGTGYNVLGWRLYSQTHMPSDRAILATIWHAKCSLHTKFNILVVRFCSCEQLHGADQCTGCSYDSKGDSCTKSPERGQSALMSGIL